MAPGQVRRGLRLTSRINECLDAFCQAVGFKSITLEALFYHNAIVYERHGFRYFRDEPFLRRIHEEFAEGGLLHRLLDGSFFRRPEFAGTVRGRSWAIHSGLLDEARAHGFPSWSPPRMYRMVGKRFQVETAKGIPY